MVFACKIYYPHYELYFWVFDKMMGHVILLEKTSCIAHQSSYVCVGPPFQRRGGMVAQLGKAGLGSPRNTLSPFTRYTEPLELFFNIFAQYWWIR